MKKLTSRPHVTHVLLAFGMTAIMLVGCEVKNAGHETLQDAQEQECFETQSPNSPDCLDPESFDEYERRMQSYPF
ncbi:MAG: hypothetical protein MRJ96_12295 [Nitrospirales bacterium]|nr:hypothetical protein [Nitrospira sp.]MDR4502222.1 hypothetical protein [Nitrospirales bacterium]